MKKWFVSAKKADFTQIGEKFHITPMTARIIRNRDVVGEEQIRRYLQGGLDDLYSPWLLYGMKDAIGLLQQAVSENKKKPSENKRKREIVNRFINPRF